MRDLQSPSVFRYFCIVSSIFPFERLRSSKIRKYARTLKVSRRFPGWVKDLIPKHGILIKVQFREISRNLAGPTPAGGPRGHFIWVNFTPYYGKENNGIFRVNLYCQKLQNSLNLMVILNS